jgi:uncharacterized coiled-coil protein SlyX
MPLSQAQIEAIGKIDGGTAIIDQIEADHESAVEQYKKTNSTLLRENVERKRTIQEMKLHIKNAGLDPEGSLEEQLTALSEKVKVEISKDVTPNKEVDALKKDMKSLMDKFSQSEQQRIKAEEGIKTEKVKSHFAPKLVDHFGDNAELVLENGMVKGVFAVDENGQPGIKQGEEILFGEQAFNALRQMYPKQAVTKQKGGAGDTGARGAKGAQGAAKTMSSEEYDTQIAKGADLTKFFADGGILKD